MLVTPSDAGVQSVADLAPCYTSRSVCLSFRPSVRPSSSVRPTVRPSVRPPVRPSDRPTVRPSRKLYIQTPHNPPLRPLCCIYFKIYRAIGTKRAGNLCQGQSSLPGPGPVQPARASPACRSQSGRAGAQSGPPGAQFGRAGAQSRRAGVQSRRAGPNSIWGVQPCNQITWAI